MKNYSVKMTINIKNNNSETETKNLYVSAEAPDLKTVQRIIRTQARNFTEIEDKENESRILSNEN